MDKLSFFYDEIKSRYQNIGIFIKPKKLNDLIEIQIKQANKKYLTLPKPKICSQKAYISLWINQEIIKDIATKSLKTIKTNNSPRDLKEAINFFQKETYHHLSPNTDKSILVSVTQDFIKVIKEKNIFAQNRGYKSYIDLRLSNGQVSKKEFQNFFKKINTLTKKSKKYILGLNPSNLEQINPCFICQSKSLPFKNIDSFINSFSKKYPILRKYIKKILINLSDKSNSEYIKETDSFQININQNISLNHQIIDFIHELCHIELMVKIFKKDSYIHPNPYVIEKKVIKKEINLIKKYLPEMYLPKIQYMLTTILQTTFEINLFQNPNQNPTTLYQKLLKQFNFYQKYRENEYLFNKNILFKNLSQLNYAIAYTHILTDIF